MKIIVGTLMMVMVVTTVVYGGGFNDLLKDVLVTSTSNQAIGSSRDYTFAPGDPIIKKDTYVVYYAGYEVINSVKILRLSKVTSGGTFTITYPDPQEIRVQSYRFQVVDFNNISLRLRMLEQ